MLVLTSEDATGEKQTKAVSYADLPPGVSVSEADKNRKVEFRLVERGTGD